MVDSLNQLYDRLKTQQHAPVAEWNPAHNGVMDLCIRRDGSWWYQGSPISREAMVRLFATVLRREPDGGYVLVTPVEKWQIEVEDAPFLAVAVTRDGAREQQNLLFETNTGDIVCADQDHPLYIVEDEAGNPSPYIIVRADLPALLSRSVYYELVDLCESYGEIRGNRLGIESAGHFFELGRLS